MMLPIGRLKALKNKGFTFIELILVAIIILVLVALSTPLFRKPFSSLQLKDTSQHLIQLMRYVQAKAVAERRFCRINFDFEKGLFWPTVEEELSPGEFKRIKGKWAKTLSAPDSITISSLEDIPTGEEAAYISFYPDGSSDKAKIKISDNKGKSFIITTERTISCVEAQD